MTLVSQVFFGILLSNFGYLLYQILQSSQPSIVNVGLNHQLQHEITTPGPLLDSDGRLVESGWSRSEIKTFNASMIAPPLLYRQLDFLRLKRWQFYNVVNGKMMFFVIIANIGYSASVQVILWDFELNSLQFVDEVMMDSQMYPIFGDDPQWRGNLDLQSKHFDLKIESYQDSEFKFSNIVLNATKEGTNVEANLKIRKNQTADDITLIAPLSADSKHFFYNVKSFSLAARGTINYNGTVHDIKKGSLACRDWGRGIFNYNTYWFWAYGQGYMMQGEQIDYDKPIALNLGRGYEHSQTVKAYEDSLFLEGQIIRLNPTAKMLQQSHNDTDIISFASQLDYSSGSFKIVFTPDIVLDRRVNYILIQSHMNMQFGSYQGWIIDHDLNKLHFQIPGFYQENKSKW